MDQKLYVELDALLDTRLGTVSRLSEDAAIELLTNARYADRMSDDMGRLTDLITTDDYQAAYRQRDVDTLVVSRPTALSFMLAKIVSDLEQQMVAANPKVEAIEIDVNVYPYQLTAQENDDIAASIMARCATAAVVRTIYVPPRELTMEMIKVNEWVALIMYNFTDWAAEVIDRLEKYNVHLPSVTCFIPLMLISEDNLPTEEEMTAPNGQKTDPFEALKGFLAEVIAIEYMPAWMYTIIDLPPEAQPTQGEPS